MNEWDELFEDRLADAGYLVSAIDEAGDHVTLMEAPVGEVERIAGEALLSDESVERAAREMCWQANGWEDGQDVWEAPEQVAEEIEEWVPLARAALAAAIGDK